MEGDAASRPTLAQFSDCFPDVLKQWYAPFICAAKLQNFISGYLDGNFWPKQHGHESREPQNTFQYPWRKSKLPRYKKAIFQTFPSPHGSQPMSKHQWS